MLDLFLFLKKIITMSKGWKCTSCQCPSSVHFNISILPYMCACDQIYYIIHCRIRKNRVFSFYMDKLETIIYVIYISFLLNIEEKIVLHFSAL